MPSAFQDALAQLDAAHSASVQLAFASWSGDARLERVHENIAGETALTSTNFVALLATFAVNLASGTAPAPAWQTTCHAHQYRGSRLPGTRCPSVLGRAKSLQAHADRVSDDSAGALTRKEALADLSKQSGESDRSKINPFLFDAYLGNTHLIWATFDHRHPDTDPFVMLPVSRSDVHTALGLGHLLDTEPLILLHWSHADSGSPPLYRPTVADAGSYPAYCPCAAAAEPWGWTQPLPPNPRGFPPQPEVVLHDMTSRGLRLPFRVV